MIQHRELPVLNGRRVDVRHLELAPNAINDEASKKLGLIVYYKTHNCDYSLVNLTPVFKLHFYI